MEAHVEHYKTDFELDANLLLDATKKAEKTPVKDRVFLWMARTCRTWCLQERNLFLKGSHEYLIWNYYGGQADGQVLAYAVEVDGMEDGKAIGSFYELDCKKHTQHVIESALPVGQKKLIYAKGARMQPAEEPVPTRDDPVLGELKSFQLIPADPGQLAALLDQERKSREKLQDGDIKKHIAMLQGKKRKNK